MTQATTLTSTAEDVKPRNKPNVSAGGLFAERRIYQALSTFVRQGVPSYLLKPLCANLAPRIVAGSAEPARSAYEIHMLTSRVETQLADDVRPNLRA